MNTFSYLWQYILEFPSEWEMIQIKFVGKIKTRTFMSSNFFFWKSWSSWANAQEDRQCTGTYNITLGHVRETNVAVEKQ